MLILNHGNYDDDVGEEYKVSQVCQIFNKQKCESKPNNLDSQEES